MVVARLFAKCFSELSLTSTLNQHARLTSLHYSKELLPLHRTICITCVSSVSSKLPSIEGIPAKPKRPCTSFVSFMLERQEQLVKKGLNVQDATKELAKKWKELTPEQKMPYVLKFRNETEKHAKDLEEYNEMLSMDDKMRLLEYKRIKSDIRKKMKLKQKMRELNKPRRALHAYAHFIQQQSTNRESKTRAANNSSLFKNWFNKSRGSIHPNTTKVLWKEISEKWKSMSAEEKKPYQDLAAKDTLRYSKEISEWKTKMVDEGHVDILRSFERKKTENKSKKK